jgi:ribonuclease-3
MTTVTIDPKPYQEFSLKTFGFEFNTPDLLVMAFTHRSYINEHKKSAEHHNERVEFLGDAVLELVVTEFLYATYPNEPEGILTNWRSALVRTESIGAAATKLEFESMLRLSRGEKRGTQRARQQILANSFEAVVGAIYIDQGFVVAKKMITDSIIATLPSILESGSWRDPKSYLQEVAQERDSKTPVYKVMSEIGPDHDKVFTLGVFIGTQLRGTGSGSSKQSAQQEAAKQALEYYQQL